MIDVMDFHCTLLHNAKYGNTHSRPKDKDPLRLSQRTRSFLKCCCNVIRPTLHQVLVGCIKCNEIKGVLCHICAYIGKTGPGETSEDGDMNKVTLPSGHRFRN